MAISCEGVLRVLAERRRAGLTVEFEYDSPLSGREAVSALVLLSDSGRPAASGPDDAEGDTSG
ncbi:hypothetical protein AB0E96_14405 [Kitasatospora sp. NPDC036755]|uniref:hypothetical protein n=1 Tax=Kitasatospora sp. NPDC036755 TaxID=3154600 RepID=UPI0033EB06A6